MIYTATDIRFWRLLDGSIQAIVDPLPLAVLVLLFERPMHPYEIAATLKMLNKHHSIKSLWLAVHGD